MCWRRRQVVDGVSAGAQGFVLKCRDERCDENRCENRFERGFEFKCVFESRFEGRFDVFKCVYTQSENAVSELWEIS